MFKNVADILEKFTIGQRIVALILILVTIIIILFPTTNEDLIRKIETQSDIIIRHETITRELSLLNSTLYNQLMLDKQECTNRVIDRENQILQYIDEMRARNLYSPLKIMPFQGIDTISPPQRIIAEPNELEHLKQLILSTRN